MKSTIVLFAIIAALLVTQTIAGADQAAPPQGGLVTSINEFGLSTLRAVTDSSPQANVCLSPVSLDLALGMADLGARGATAKAMDQVLGTSGMDADDLKSQTSSLIDSLNHPGADVTVTVADSLWIDNYAHLLPDFTALCATDYGADVANLDLHSPASIDRINAWVADKTNGKIVHILNQADRGCVSVLANALYFKGPWQTPFDKALTSPRPFHPGAGKADVTVPMMDRRGGFEYGDIGGAQIVKLPFARDGRFAFIVALPGGGPDDVGQLLAGATGDAWTSIQSSLIRQYGEVVLPKFKVSYEGNMNPALKQLGMGIAFDLSRADFSGMVKTPPPVAIGYVKHDTYLSVDEDGAEAAAATVIGMRSSAIMRTPPLAFTMVVDHPFICAIVDTKTGAILFVGAIHNPS